ncbi:hypothetical protein G6F56_012580 [Rhizopus delemar]|nr:hypothetical protein G6F56_012580 [Rhizopus delemar]
MSYQSVKTQSVKTQSATTQSVTTTSIVVSEITESEGIGLEEKKDYEILDEDRLTEHDFLSLMNSEEEDEESESDIDHWFPSLLRTSAIEFLEDNSDVEDEESEAIIEQDSDQEETLNNGKRSSSLAYKYDQRKRIRRSEQVPIEVDYIILADKS